MEMHQKLLVFTDLDGSLLDHYSYSFAAAQPMLELLELHAIPVIPVTSKTCAELLSLREDLNNHHPFIVENGAAVFIPTDYFQALPAGCTQINGFNCFQFSKPRAAWQSLLKEYASEFSEEFVTFEQAGVEGIIEMTGLDHASATLANERDFSEPLRWLGSEDRKQIFIRQLEERGATVLQGGRFLHITGGCDKGKALRWLTEQYQRENPQSQFTTLAAGDSHNDVAMLEASDLAVLISSPVHQPPAIQHAQILKTDADGPQGWADAIQQLSIPFLKQPNDSTKPLDGDE